MPEPPASPTPPLCSVVLVTWNRRRELEAALDSVFRQSIADSLEVLVVDNGSTDGTVQWLLDEYPHPVRLLLYGENLGASVARNAAIRLARGAFVCFLDSDAEILSHDALERCVGHLRARAGGGVRAVSATIWARRDRSRVFVKGCYLTPQGHFHGERSRSDCRDPHFLSTCFAVWDRRLLKQLRGFDPWYFWGIEDVDLALRARYRLGTRFEVLEDVEILHEMSGEGRHYQPDNFDAVFHAFERQRLYLAMAQGGLPRFLRLLLVTPLRIRRLETDAWEQPLSRRRKLWALVLYPALRCLMLPRDWFLQRRDHLARTPMPEEVTPRPPGP